MFLEIEFATQRYIKSIPERAFKKKENEMATKGITLNGIKYEQVVGTPKDGDQLIDGTLYRPIPAAPAATPATTQVHTPVTTEDATSQDQASQPRQTNLWPLVALAAILVLGALIALWLLHGNSNSATSSNGSIPVDTAASCKAAAQEIGAPIGSSICDKPVSDAPALRATSGSEIAFGTITFDSETRVWVLENFVVPTAASYSYDYAGREQNVLSAPFVVGSEKNPVNGENFRICWNTEGDCTPPVAIEFFQ